MIEGRVKYKYLSSYDESVYSECWVETIQNWLIVEDVEEPDAVWEEVDLPGGTIEIEMNGKLVEIPDPKNPPRKVKQLVKDGYRGLRVPDAMPDLAYQLAMDKRTGGAEYTVFVWHDRDTGLYFQFPLVNRGDGAFQMGDPKPMEAEYFLAKKAEYESEVNPTKFRKSTGEAQNQTAQQRKAEILARIKQRKKS